MDKIEYWYDDHQSKWIIVGHDGGRTVLLAAAFTKEYCNATCKRLGNAFNCKVKEVR